jgi:hypothetical protein
MDLQKSEEIEQGCAASCCGSCGSCGKSDEDPLDSVHKNIIRIVGVITACFGIIELGLGAGVYGFLAFSGVGAFWAGIL